MRSQHRAPLVAYAIVAIVGLVVIMQTITPNVMALQKVPNTLAGHGPYRVEDPPAPLSPVHPTQARTTTSPRPAHARSQHAGAGDGAAPVIDHGPAQGAGRHPGTSHAPTPAPPSAPAPTPGPGTLYLVPPIGPLPGVPAPALVTHLLADVISSDSGAGGQGTAGGQGNGSGTGKAKGGSTSDVVSALTKSIDKGTSDQQGDGDQQGSADQQSVDADGTAATPAKKPVRTLVAAVAPKTAGCLAAAAADAGDVAEGSDPLPTIDSVLAGAGIGVQDETTGEKAVPHAEEPTAQCLQTCDSSPAAAPTAPIASTAATAPSESPAAEPDATENAVTCAEPDRTEANQPHAR